VPGRGHELARRAATYVAEDDVLAIEPRGLDGAEEELRAVGAPAEAGCAIGRQGGPRARGGGGQRGRASGGAMGERAARDRRKPALSQAESARSGQSARRVRSGVGHRENARARVLEREVLVGKLGAVDRLAAGAIARGEVTTLTHCRAPRREGEKTRVSTARAERERMRAAWRGKRGGGGCTH
jgi:hypothetical protein